MIVLRYKPVRIDKLRQVCGRLRWAIVQVRIPDAVCLVHLTQIYMDSLQYTVTTWQNGAVYQQTKLLTA